MSKEPDVQQTLVSVGFSINDIQRALEIYEKQYGSYPDYTVKDLTEIIIKLQMKEEANNNELEISYNHKALKALKEGVKEDSKSKEGEYLNSYQKTNDDDWSSEDEINNNEEISFNPKALLKEDSESKDDYPNIFDEKSNVDASSEGEADEIIINFTEKPFPFTIRSGDDMYHDIICYDETRKTTQISSIKENNKHKCNGLEVGLYVLQIGDINISHYGFKEVAELLNIINVPIEIKFSKYPAALTIYDSKPQTEFQPFFTAKINRYHRDAYKSSCGLITVAYFCFALFAALLRDVMWVTILSTIFLIAIVFVVVCWCCSMQTIEVGYDSTMEYKTNNVSIRITRCRLCNDWYVSNWCCTDHVESVELMRDKPFEVKERVWEDSRGSYHSFGDIELNLRNLDNIKMQRINSRVEAKSIANQMENKLNQAITQNTVYQFENGYFL